MEDLSKSAAEVFNKHAESYQTKFMDVSLYHDSFDRFCAAITQPNAKILELACGPGNITRYLLQQRPDFQLLGTDLAPNMVTLAQHNNPQATFQVMDCRDIATLQTRYHALMIGFCLPYLSKEATLKLIADAAEILLPQGVIYLSTMEDDYENSGYRTSSQGDQIYMHFHQADYLTAALKENGFQIIHLDRIEYPGPDTTPVIDLILIATKPSNPQNESNS
jgi:predicted TPR repeat methyltransferase